MRHHDFIQKKVVGYTNDYYQNLVSNNLVLAHDQEEWNFFIEKIENFDEYDNVIDLLDLEDEKIIALQYFYSHTDSNGLLSTLDKASEGNVWIKDNMTYYKKIEELVNKRLNQINGGDK